jgi:glycosyltransferase involved in cell wall biosynthesis
MRILQVLPRYLPVLGGVEEHVRNISERLAHQHEVTVFTTDPSGRLPREEIINGVLVRRFRGVSPQNAYHISIAMLRELQKSEFDVVHGHNYHAFPVFFSRYASKKRFIVTPHYHGHGSSLLRDYLIKLYKPLGKKIFQEADRVIAVSNYEKALLMRDFTINGDIAVIPNGIDLAEFKGIDRFRKKDDAQRTILYVGRLDEYKGIQYVVQALPLLADDIHLEIVGNGPYKGHVEGIIRELGLENRVEFYQDLAREELLARYAGADLFVLMSRFEAFGITVGEALASKTPCIVANTSALSEWIDGRNCRGIDYPINVDHLADLIKQTIGHRVGEVKLWDWDRVAEEIVKIYDEGI